MKFSNILIFLFVYLLIGCDILRPLRVRHEYTLIKCPESNFQMPNLILNYDWELQKEKPVNQCKEMSYYSIGEEKKKFSHHPYSSSLYSKFEKGLQCKLVVINYGWCDINESRKHCIERLKKSDEDLSFFYKKPILGSDKFLEILSKKGLPEIKGVRRTFSDNPDDQEACTVKN